MILVSSPGLHGSLDDALSSDQYHEDHHTIDGKLHDRRVPGHDLLRLGEEPEYDGRNLSELLILMVFPHVSLYHTGRVDIFLNGIVEYIVLVKYLNKVWVAPSSQYRSAHRPGSAP